MNTSGSLITVLGLPRSGTSWLAKVLSFDRDFTYYREPDNFDRVAGAERRFGSLYLASGMTDAQYESHMIRALSGQIATSFTLMEGVARVMDRIPRGLRFIKPHVHRFLPRKRNVLVKLVNSNFAMDFLQWRFPHGKQVYIVRHPCGLFGSWQRLGWTPRPELLVQQSELMRDHLEPYRDLLLSAESYWERAGAYWGAVTLVAYRQFEQARDRTLLQYEWLCEDPEVRFHAVYARLGLKWNRSVETFLRGSKQPSLKPYSLSRDPLKQIDAWKSSVPAADVETCRRFAEPFNLPFYPDFNSVACNPAWYSAAEAVQVD